MSHPTCLRKQILTLSLTCSLFHDIFRNDVYSSITIRSTSSLTKFTTYLNTHTWPGQPTAINSLTLRWLQDSHDYFFATPISRHEASQKIIMNLRTILESHTGGLKYLTLDFPGAGISFQTAVLTASTSIRKRCLKHLHITNGLCPLSHPATLLLCAISALCAQSIEELIINTACETPNARSPEFYCNELHVPGRRMFRAFEKLQKLKRLRLKGVEGFTDGCLAWILSGSQLSDPTVKGKALMLEGCQALTEGGVKRILGVMGGLERARITFAGNDCVKQESSGVPTPRTWWSLDYGDETSSKAGNDAAFSFMCDSDSTVDTMEREETIYEDEIFHLDTSGDFDAASHSSNKGSHRYRRTSSQSTYSYRSTNTHQFTHQSSYDVHICDITAACQHLPRLDIPTSSNLSYSSLNHHHSRRKENKFRDSYSSVSARHHTPAFSDKDAEYINHHLAATRASAPIIHPLQNPMFPRSSYSSSPIPPLNAPDPGFFDREDGGPENLQDGERKRLYNPADGAVAVRGPKSMSLRGLWEGAGSVRGGKRWFRGRK